jgi:hypothetical protein
MVYEKCYDPESIPTGARRMGGVPRGKEFAPEGQKLVANYIRRFFLLARLPDQVTIHFFQTRMLDFEVDEGFQACLKRWL